MKETLNSTDVKKELYKSKVNATFSHYCSGNLYYNVALYSGLYQFPISTIETVEVTEKRDNADPDFFCKNYEAVVNKLQLSSDLGITNFERDIKASMLNRWIDKAIKNNTFIVLK